MDKVRKATTNWLVLVVMVAGSYVWAPGEAMASESTEIVDEIASLETGPIVRRQLLHRSARLEVQPMLAFSLNDAFIRNGMPGLSASYFLNNVFGVGVTANFGALHFDTSLRRNLEAELSTANPSRLEEISYSKFNWTVDLGLIYVPAFGKFSVMNSFFTHYDFHLMGGMAMVNETVEAAVDGGFEDGGLAGLRPGGMFGGGLRFFMGDRISVNFQLRNYLFTRAQVSQGSAAPQLGNTVILSAGVGIFLPGEVMISR